MIIAGTGHRPPKLGGYSLLALNHLANIAEDWLESHAKDNGTPIIISGMALGWDQAIGYAARNLKFPLHAYIPFEGQELKWPKESQHYYEELLDYAQYKYIVSPGGYTAYKMQKRNEKMVQHSDLILAMYDGTQGGTANCIEYAQLKKKPIINLYDQL